MKEENVAEAFARDTKNHTMNIKKDEGIYRHITFSNNGSSVYRFSLTTWPWYLAISGDCGDFMFSRIENMFDFFRSDRINPGYWGEKMTSISRFGGYNEFSRDKFNEEVEEYLEEHWTYGSDEEKAAVRKEVKEYVLNCDDHEYAAHTAANSFESEYGHQFTDFWECHLTKHTHQYIWCLHAIIHGIKEYDREKNDRKNKGDNT